MYFVLELVRHSAESSPFRQRFHPHSSSPRLVREKCFPHSLVPSPSCVWSCNVEGTARMSKWAKEGCSSSTIWWLSTGWSERERGKNFKFLWKSPKTKSTLIGDSDDARSDSYGRTEESSLMLFIDSASLIRAKSLSSSRRITRQSSLVHEMKNFSLLFPLVLALVLDRSVTVGIKKGKIQMTQAEQGRRH